MLTAGRCKSKIHQIDVNTAFLYSNLDEVVYVEQLEGFEEPGKEDWVCLLNRALYGLKQSPRAWFQQIAAVLANSISNNARLTHVSLCIQTIRERRHTSRSM